MNPIIQTMLNWRRLLLLIGSSLLGGLYTSAIAQTCPSGWTSVASGTVYPDTATGTIYAGSLSNIAFGGMAEGQGVQLFTGNAVVVKFNQVLTTSGSLKIVAKQLLSTLYPGTLSVSFSSDGVTYSSAQTINTITTSQSYSVTVPSAFQYVKLATLSNSWVGVDDVHYQGPYCQIDSYSNCAAGQVLRWQNFNPVSAKGTVWVVSGNVLQGADGISADLTATEQGVLVKFQKTLAVGDSIIIEGGQYTSVRPGNFTVYTSMDGGNYTPLQTTAFTVVTPKFQKLKFLATQEFQYVKIMPSGTGQVSIDAIHAYGQGCVTQETGSCSLQYKEIPAVAVVDGNKWGNELDDVLYKDGFSTLFYTSANWVTVDFGVSSPLGTTGEVFVLAAGAGTSTPGNFYVETSNDNVTWTKVGETVVVASSGNNLQTYRFFAPSSFRYVKVTAIGSLAVEYISAAMFQCVQCSGVTGTVTTVQTTCGNTGAANSDAKLVLSTYSSGVIKVGYSAGSSYTGPDYSAAMAVTAAPMTLVNNLANPVAGQPYTVRIFKDASCYKDYMVTLISKKCLTSDLSLTANSVTASGNKGEQVNYTFTLTNAGPDVATGVKARLPVPMNTKFLSAVPTIGTYNSGTSIWDVGTVAVGSQTITLTLQVK